jgi:hypothetical protein
VLRLSAHVRAKQQDALGTDFVPKPLGKTR